ncbi:MAG TPA: hypothetical protein VLW54_00580 [Candidatus Acidoferrales bacterium]|nr:hypothetical protein [Candidatus Acidoferrales bacterium]
MSPSTKSAQVALLALACAAAAGCHRQSVQAAPPVTSPASTETAQPAPAPPSGTEGQPAPSGAGTETPPASPPATIPVPKPVEPKPKPAPPPAQPETPAPKPAPPQITLRLSPADEAQLKAKTQKAVAEAQANLHKADGRRLSDAQHDLVEKIQSFLEQAREAGELPDWNRASILAEKARLLSIELANSL